MSVTRAGSRPVTVPATAKTLAGTAAPSSGTTTGPFWPKDALWMWASVGWRLVHAKAKPTEVPLGRTKDTAVAVPAAEVTLAGMGVPHSGTFTSPLTPATPPWM